MVSRFLLFSFVVLLFTGCWSGRTGIYTSDGQAYTIYKIADGKQEYVCSNGEPCEIKKRGAPEHSELRAIDSQNNTVGTANISRNVTMASILWMPFTYCLSAYFYQAYDESVMIYISKPATEESTWSVEVDEKTNKGKIVFEEDKEEERRQKTDKKDAKLDSNGDIVWE